MPGAVIYNPPSGTGLDIIWQDEFLIVVNKPCGLLAVPGRGAEKADCLITRAQGEFPDALVVHRLDMDTSGLMVLARGEMMHRLLSRLFRERQVEKRYVAIVLGKLEIPEGTIDLPMGADWPNRPKQKIDHDAGKPSLTYYHLLNYAANSHSTRVALEPVTGRTHQLRVHMASLGHPIRGDALYGGANGSERLMLHAERLCFVHPSSGERLTLQSEAPF